MTCVDLVNCRADPFLGHNLVSRIQMSGSRNLKILKNKDRDSCRFNLHRAQTSAHLSISRTHLGIFPLFEHVQT